ncbi:MAG: glycyl-radical enzyme activating protein [Candidatus Epulonipiscioides saccharophilum]|nr:MAG: glycyl-radical enzyme activating protein [Epulopiscium sp. AS2M-Bin001]
MSQTGIIFNIQHFTIHDGPGIRTEIFFKGCPLHCHWCSNPEGIACHMEVAVNRKKCISRKNCGECETVCPQPGALVFSRGKLHSINREKCIRCLQCVNACPSEALSQYGKEVSVEDCMKEIRKDLGYYKRSGGGITVSGGEPLLQSDFVAELFKTCKAEGIHTCCESSLYLDWSQVEKILPYTDLFISDIKHMDPRLHKNFTGVNNKLILENLVKLSQTDTELILRIPIIPNVNENMINIEATADFILNKLHGHVKTLQLLSFMRLGEDKYSSLNMPYNMKDVKINRTAFQSVVTKIATYMNLRGIHCIIGTKEY